MNTYEIEITEVSSRLVSIDANSLPEAVDIAGFLYKREEIVLETSDHKHTEIDIPQLTVGEIDENLKDFIYQKAKQTLDVLSGEELAKIAFGSLANASIEFEKRDKNIN
jgi:hypothetical protein